MYRQGKRIKKASRDERIQQAQDFFDRNSDEAWEQIRETVSRPRNWIFLLLAILLTVILGGLLSVALSIHAPSLPSLPPAEEDRWGDEDFQKPITQTGREEGAYTFLLVGTDVSTYNTDTIMVMSYDVDDQEVNLLSIPRDTMINVKRDIKRINSAYSVGGIKGLQEQIKKLIGFAPDYYVTINVQAFAEVITLLGGVDFDVPRNMDYDDPVQGLHIHLKKGMQHLDGVQAMGLVRWRHNNDYTLGYNDQDRMKTQQEFLRAAMDQCLSLKNWDKIGELVEMFHDNVKSDLTLGEMLWFAKKAMSLSPESLQTFTMPGNYAARAWSRTYRNYQSYVTPDGKALAEMINSYFNPYQGDIRLSDLDIMSVREDGSVYSSTGYTADTQAAQPPVKPEKPQDPGEQGETEDPGGMEIPWEPLEPPAVIPEEPEEKPSGPEEPSAPEQPAQGPQEVLPPEETEVPDGGAGEQETVLEPAV